MWLRRKHKLEKESIKEAFSKYTADEKIVEMLSDAKDPELATKHVDFILVLVREDSRQAETIRQAVGIIQQRHGIIESITSTLITVYFGAPYREPNSRQKRKDLVIQLAESLGSDLAIIHGECDCRVGIVGDDKRASYTALLPEYRTKLAELVSLDFGQIREV